MSHLFAWGALALFMLASSFVGYRLVSAMPWRSAEHCQRLGLPLAAMLAPFLLGLLTVTVLLLMGGASHSTHVWTIGVVLACACALLSRWGRGAGPSSPPRDATRRVDRICWLLAGIFALCVACLLYLALALPLTENDALEYGLVGRAIHEARSLGVYPLLDPGQAASGFFAPWTHPPLYTSLIYLTYLLQGSAAEAVLMKALAPWFMLSAAWGIYGIGRLQGPRIAWVASLLFLTTPLLSVGAQTAAIDALPVAGMVLMMVALIGLDQGRRSAPIFTGLMVGLALWTHSQAVLYIPILMATVMVAGGLSSWRASVAYTFTALLVMTLVAAFPYGRNFAIYGSLISDNPVVFALPSLDWDSYFKYARSIYDWSTRLQYGVLKGLLSPRSYGVVFWAGALAFIYLLFSGQLRRWCLLLIKGSKSQLEPVYPVLIPLCISVVYFAGMLASLVVGTDLMIKNDRYLLVVVPAVSLVAACGLSELFSRFWAKWTRPEASWTRRVTTKLVLAAGLLAQALIFLVFGNLVQWMQLVDVTLPSPSVPAYLSSHVNRMLSGTDLPADVSGPSLALTGDPLTKFPGILLAKAMHDHVPQGEAILAVRPADMFYSDRRMVSYLDPRMVKLYAETDPARFASQLKDLGVGYVQMANYFIPPVANTALMSLLAQPELSTLVSDVNSSQLYRLNAPESKLPQDGVRRKVDLSRWTWLEYPSLGSGRLSMALRRQGVRVQEFPYANSSSSKFLPRSYSHTLEVGGGQRYDPEENAPVAVQAGQEYVVNLDVEGEGFIRVWMWQLTTPDEPTRKADLIGDFVLSPTVPALHFQRRIRTEDEVAFVRIAIERYGISSLTLKQAYLEELDSRGALR